MKLSEAWGNYYSHTGTTSSNVRKLAFTGIALVWIASGGGVANVEQVTVDGELHWPLYLLVVALAADFLQYVVLSWSWRAFARKTEREVDASADFRAPVKVNRIGEGFFAAKVALVMVGYGWLLVTLGQRFL